MTQGIAQSDIADEGEISIQEILAFLQRHWRLVAGCALGVALLVVAVLALREPRYTSAASFVPQTVDKTSGLAGLAAQFGVTAGGQDATESPAFYADLVKTREILTAVLQTSYRVSTGGRATSSTLIDLLDVSASSEGRRLDKAIQELTDRVRVDYKARTGVVSLAVVMKTPELAQQVAQRLLDEVSRFNQEKRNAKATAERKFTEGRIAELQVELRVAEDRLQSFLQGNRDYRNSPDLTFQHDRLAQQVEFLREIYTTVSQANEKARMDEARDTPVIMVIETPSLPHRPDGRGLIKFGLLGLALGCLAGIGAAWIAEALARRRAGELSFERAPGVVQRA